MFDIKYMFGDNLVQAEMVKTYQKMFNKKIFFLMKMVNSQIVRSKMYLQ